MLHGILLCSCLGLASAPGASAPLQSATGTQTGTGASSEALAKADSAIGSDRETALVRATRSASGSVAAVVVTSNEVVPRRYADPMLDYFFGAPPPEVRQSRSWGSGVLVDSSGHILTNFHVVEAAATPRNAASISVTLPDGRRFQAAFVGGDPDNDLAVLRITGTSLPVARVASRPPVIGEWVLAIGNPFGHLIDDPRPTVTAGVVSAVDRSFSPSRASPCAMSCRPMHPSTPATAAVRSSTPSERSWESTPSSSPEAGSPWVPSDWGSPSPSDGRCGSWRKS